MHYCVFLSGLIGLQAISLVEGCQSCLLVLYDVFVTLWFGFTETVQTSFSTMDSTKTIVGITDQKHVVYFTGHSHNRH